MLFRSIAFSKQRILVCLLTAETDPAKPIRGQKVETFPLNPIRGQNVETFPLNPIRGQRSLLIHFRVDIKT